MGKKRRYINKIGKFGKKMFDFLDKVDGVDDGLLNLARTGEKRATLVDFVFTDDGNQRGSWTATVLGAPADGKVTYEFDKDGKAKDINVTDAGSAAATAEAVDFNNIGVADGEPSKEFTITVPKLAGGTGKKVTVKLIRPTTADPAGPGFSAGPLPDHTIELLDSDDNTNRTNLKRAIDGQNNANLQTSTDLDSGVAGLSASLTAVGGANRVTLTASTAGEGGNKIRLRNVEGSMALVTTLSGGAEASAENNRITFSTQTPAQNSDGVKNFSVGNHFVDCTIKKADDTTLGTVRKHFHVRENKINFKPLCGFAAKAGSQIEFTKANLFADTPGKNAAHSVTDAALGQNGIKVTVRKNGGPVDATLLGAGFDADGDVDGTILKADLAALGATVDVLASAAAGNYEFTVTPLATDDTTELNQSKVTFTIVVA